MKQYIDKATLVAEIEKRRDSLISLSESCPANTAAKSGFYAQAQTLEGIKNFIDTLEVKEVQEEPVSGDLEEAADNALSNVLNTHEIINIRSCLEMFRYGAKWQKEQLMKDTISAEFYSNEVLN